MNQHELEEKLMYSVVVAGKSAKFAEQAMTRFWRLTDYFHGGPFDRVRQLRERGDLMTTLQKAKVGNYKKTHRAFDQMAFHRPDLETCTPQQLEIIHGIGPKTSRFFIIWTRPESRYAALDVHVLRWMRSIGHEVPRSTPQSAKRYAHVERLFLDEADRRGMTPRELDAKIWSEATGIV